MPFKNRIRLPFYLKQPQFPAEANRFRLANGTTVTMSVVIRKTYQLETDNLPEKLHQRLTIALNHDEVNIEGDRYVGGVAMDGDYEIEWPDFLDYPLGKAKAQIQVTPFAATNDNCQTCEEVTQITLADDTIADPIDEGTNGTVNAFTNDTICCSPITAEITTFNTTYVSAATIDEETGIATITIKNPAPSATGVLLATYRVTCPNGGYDEADIYGTVVGTEPACEEPTGLTYENLSPGSDQVSFTGTGNFEWQLFTCDDLGTPVDSGTTASSPISFVDLTPGQCYIISIRKDCGGGSFSEWADLEFNVPVPETEDCGRFTFTNEDFPNTPADEVTYMDCAGVLRTSIVKTTKTVCALMNAFNVPMYFESFEGTTTYLYIEPCA